MRLTIKAAMRQEFEVLAGSLGFKLHDLPGGASSGRDVVEVEGRVGSEPGLLVGRAGHMVYEVDGKTLATLIATEFKLLGLTLGVAESCTGGLLGAAITDVAGSSDFFKGGIISYDNDIKRTLLGVPAKVLNAVGAASEETAQLMAVGAKRALNVDFALSITGIAGPSGGTDEKPVGTVYLGIAGKDSVFAISRIFEGSRREVRKQSVRAAIAALWANLRYGSKQ